MFSLAYVILPFSDIAPAEAIRASLAPFQRGTRRNLPESMIAFHDETDDLRQAWQTRFTFTVNEQGGLRIEEDGAMEAHFYIDIGKVREEMRRLGLQRWCVRFVDTMNLDSFVDCFVGKVERHPDTGAFGLWRNPLGQWDFWDLGGRFDGHIIGERSVVKGRSVGTVSSGPSRGRAVLARIEDRLAEALGQEPIETVDVHTDQNIEIVATLLDDARAGRANAFPLTVVLPPNVVEDRLRWIGTWPKLGPLDAIAQLGLQPDEDWKAIVTAVYARFEDHWAAGVAYHH